jgi:serine/threonine protein kinase
MKPQPRYKPGDKIGGRYLVREALMGGMGEVYLCLDLEIDQPYALKTFQARYLTNPKLRENFNHEVATWVALEKHQNIVRCYYLDTLDSLPFMRLELVIGDSNKGTDLRGWLKNGPIETRQAIEFIIDICQGLSHANNKQPGIVHRDLKPENILIGEGWRVNLTDSGRTARVSEGMVAKITDFGLAKIVQNAELTILDTGQKTEVRQTLHGYKGVVGTPPYMAPEQWRGEVLDVRTDIYAVGCILYELLMGQMTFRAVTLSGFRKQHEEAPPPTLLGSNILSSYLNDILLRCLAKHKQKRFTTVEELLHTVLKLYKQLFGKEHFAKGIDIDFTADDHNNRGNTYRKLKRYDDALAEFNRAIQLDPNNIHAYSNRGLTYTELQQYDKALADYNKAIEIDSNFADAYFNRGFTYNRLEQYNEALADFNHGIGLKPNDAKAYANRANTYVSLQQYDKALGDLSQAIRLDPTLILAYFGRANVYYQLDRYEEAVDDYQQVIQSAPTLIEPYVKIGIILSNNKKFRLALPYFEKAAQLGDSHSTQFAAKLRQILNLEIDNPAILAFEAFIEVESIKEMKQMILVFQFMTGSDFISSVEQFIFQDIPTENQPPFIQRLEWLKQIAIEQKRKEE